MTEWYYHDPEQGRVGPITSEELRTRFRAGRVRRDTLVWRDGLREWQTVDRHADALGLNATPPPLPPAAPQPPPLPPSAPTQATPPRPTPAAAPRAASGRNGCLIALAVSVALAVPVGGILAAIAIPAYRDYGARARVAEALLTATALQPQIVDYRIRHGACPDNGSEGFGPPEAYRGPAVSGIRIGPFDNDHCGMELRLHQPNQAGLHEKALWLEYDPERGAWQCSSEIANRWLPKTCRTGADTPETHRTTAVIS